MEGNSGFFTSGGLQEDIRMEPTVGEAEDGIKSDGLQDFLAFGGTKSGNWRGITFGFISTP